MTKELYPLKGIVTTVISPFIGTEKALDVESLHNEIEMACQAGVAGFLVPCLASEQWLLTTEYLGRFFQEAVLYCCGDQNDMLKE